MRFLECQKYHGERRGQAGGRDRQDSFAHANGTQGSQGERNCTDKARLLCSILASHGVFYFLSLPSWTLPGNAHQSGCRKDGLRGKMLGVLWQMRPPWERLVWSGGCDLTFLERDWGC